MPEGNVFLGEVVVVEVLAEVVVEGSSWAGFFGRRVTWSHRGIIRTAHYPGSANVQAGNIKSQLVVLRKGASLYDVEYLEMGCADVRRVCVSVPTLGWQLAA
jgi:hypothetical protein